MSHAISPASASRLGFGPPLPPLSPIGWYAPRTASPRFGRTAADAPHPADIESPFWLGVSRWVERHAPTPTGFMKMLAVLFEHWATHNPLLFVENGQLLSPKGKLVNKVLVVSGHKVRAVLNSTLPDSLLDKQHVQHLDAQGKIITPGLIDQHTHGGFGCDFNTPTPEKVQTLLQRLPAFGVTAVVPTIMTASPQAMGRAIHTLDTMMSAPAPAGARMLGLHLEGPFINPGFRGAHPTRYLVPPSMEKLAPLASPYLKLMTMAPELDDANMSVIKHLVSKGVRVNAGHSAADYGTMQKAIAAGVTGVTHLYNAMKPFHHRDTSIVNTALATPGLKAEIIADGVHVKPEVVAATVKAKQGKDIILVTDSLAVAGLPDGKKFMFGGQWVTNQNGKALNAEGNLAGATVFLNDCVKNLVQWQATDFATAASMASRNPAQHLGIKNMGRLVTGALADFVLWDANTLAVDQTFINGQSVYNRAQPKAV